MRCMNMRHVKGYAKKAIEYGGMDFRRGFWARKISGSHEHTQIVCKAIRIDKKA